MACDLDTTLENACESGIGKVDDEILLLKLIAQLTCEIQDALSGGGGGGAVSPNINGAVSPVGVVTPAAENQFYRWDDAYGAGQHSLFQATGLTSADWWQIV